MKARSAFVADLVAGGLEKTPLSTPEGVIFVYEEDATQVEVVVLEDRFPPVGPMRQISGGKTWFKEVALDPDGTIEYKLAITTGAKRDVVLDPANPERSSAPFGSNSIASGADYQAPPWLNGAGHNAGVIEPFPVESKVWGRRTDHQMLLTEGYTPGDPLPLLILHDGPEYVEYAGFRQCLGWLVSQELVPPMLVLLHRPHIRNSEYVGNPLHAEHLLSEVLPHVRSAYDVGPVYAGGASLGAVASLMAAFENPGTFSGLMLQSGSFVRKLGGPFRRGAVLQPVVEKLPEVLEHVDRLPECLVFSCGTYDGLVEDHRRLIPELATKRSGVHYREVNAGHHWRCWRDSLEFDLLTLFDSA